MKNKSDVVIYLCGFTGRNGWNTCHWPWKRFNDVSNVKFRHKLTSNTGIAIRGNTSVWGTKMNFIKLCPSV